jgi:hypothetical protein
VVPTPCEGKSLAIGRFLDRRSHGLFLQARPDAIFVNPFEQGAIGPDLFRAACDMGLEGLVSTRSDRLHRGGRSKDWIKVRNRQHHAFE